MRAKRLIVVLALSLVAGALWALTSRPARADPPCTRYVLGVDASDVGNDCTDEAHPCRTIQHAINQAVTGDMICVAKHTLAGPLVYSEQLTITKSITLDGAWDAMCVDPNNLTCSLWSIPCDPANVTIDAAGVGRVISIVNANPTIHCFTITGGDAGGGASDPNKGGGIAAWDAAPIIIHNVITGNYGCTTASCTGNGRGGGLYLANVPATAVISGNLIAHNVADDATWGQGGGLYLENASPQVLSNTFQSNRGGHSAGDGGGIAVADGSPIIADNDFLLNLGGRAVMGNGGGLFIQSTLPVTIERNLFDGNAGLRGTGSPPLFSRGGGIYFDGPLARIRNNELYGNVANLLDQRGLGGAMYLHGLSAAAEVRGNVVSDDNRASYFANGAGGGIYLDACYATVADNWIFNNVASSSNPGYGGGIYVNGGGGLILGNTITGNLALLGAVSGFGLGGGMMISNSTVLVQENRIAQNRAAAGPSANGAGGGVHVYQGTPLITGNVITGNQASQGAFGSGGGVYLDQSHAWLDSNTILDNVASGGTNGRGGGVRVGFSTAFTLTNNIIARNRASALGSGVAIASSDGVLAHNTIAENVLGDGVGVHIGMNTVVTLYNTILLSQSVAISNTSPVNSAVTAQATLFEGDALNYGAGVISTNEVPGPAALTADYRLTGGSNAIEHALLLAWVTRDIDNDPRPLGLPDVGADEYVVARIRLPLLLRDYHPLPIP